MSKKHIFCYLLINIFFVTLNNVYASTITPSKSSCEVLKQSKNILKFQEFLDKEKDANPTISQHRLSDYPVIIFDHAVTSQCFSLLEAGAPSKVFRLGGAATTREYDDYDFYKNTSIHIIGEYNGMKEILESLGIKQAMIQHFGNATVYGENLDFLIGRVEAEFSVQVHEALHGFVQQDSTRWKSPTNPPIDDEDHAPGCYMKNASVKRLHKAEFEAALAMLRHLDNVVMLKKFASEFVRRREQRYLAAGDLVWTSWSGQEYRASCSQLELQFEYGEGIPQYVEVATLLDLDLATRSDVITQWEKTFEFFFSGKAAGTRPLHSYYYTGAIQILAMRAILKSKFIGFSQKLMNEQSGKSITDHLIEVLDL